MKVDLGIYRMWLVVSIIWVAFAAASAFYFDVWRFRPRGLDDDLFELAIFVFGPLLAFYAAARVFDWIFDGFKSRVP